MGKQFPPIQGNILEGICKIAGDGLYSKEFPK